MRKVSKVYQDTPAAESPIIAEPSTMSDNGYEKDGIHGNKPTLASASPIAGINANYLADEQALVAALADAADPGEAAREKTRETAASLVAAVRRNKAREGGIDAFLQQYDLSSEEGVLLMCIAEALLRIPDADTADKLIADKITSASWKDHLGESDSLFVNASTWGLMLTGQLLQFDDQWRLNPAQMLGKLASRAGEPVVRTAMRQAMRIMGHQFVMGRTIRRSHAARDGRRKTGPIATRSICSAKPR